MTQETLTVKQVVQAGYKALDAGTLQICSVEACAGNTCLNKRIVGDKEYNCIIGAAMTPKFREAYTTSTVTTLTSIGVLSVDDLETLRYLQRFHDNLVKYICYGDITPIGAIGLMRERLNEITERLKL